jgi:hypothetical protein
MEWNFKMCAHTWKKCSNERKPLPDLQVLTDINLYDCWLGLLWFSRIHISRHIQTQMKTSSHIVFHSSITKILTFHLFSIPYPTHFKPHSFLRRNYTKLLEKYLYTPIEKKPPYTTHSRCSHAAEVYDDQIVNDCMIYLWIQKKGQTEALPNNLQSIW